MGYRATPVEYTWMSSQNPGAYTTIFMRVQSICCQRVTLSLWQQMLHCGAVPYSSNSGSAPSLTCGYQHRLYPARQPTPSPTSSWLCPRAERGTGGDEVSALPQVDLLEELSG